MTDFLTTEEIQENLYILGYEIKIDGIWGPRSQNVRDKFLSSMKISPTADNAEERFLALMNQEFVDWSDPRSKVSKFFSVEEVTKRDPLRIPTDKKVKRNIKSLALELDKVRHDWGSALKVTSWYRPPRVNAAVGGAKNSQHLYGLAADLVAVGGLTPKFEEWIKERWGGGVGLAAKKKGFVHLDARYGFPCYGTKGGIRFSY